MSAQIVLLVVIAQGLAGCGDSGSPSAPSPVPQPARPTPVYAFSEVTLSGVVSEVTPTGQAPIEDASVYCETCEDGHVYAHTDRSGFYSFRGVWVSAGIPTVLWVGKAGYQDPPEQPILPGLPGSGWREVTIDGDTRLDIQLVRR
jgi:hypothetical protein